MLGIIRNLLAILGAIALFTLLLLYARGWSATHERTPEALGALQTFAARVLASDLATAGLLRIPIEGGVSMQQAMAAMIREADRHKLKLISQSRSEKRKPKVAILNFCDAQTRDRLLAFNPVLLPYLPCRIFLYEDLQGITWAAALNLDLLVTTTPSLRRETREPIATLSDALIAVMNAGVNGKPLD